MWSSKLDDYGLVDDYTPGLREQLGQPSADYIDTGVGCNGYVARPWMYDEMLHPTSWVVSESIDFLRRRDRTRPRRLASHPAASLEGEHEPGLGRNTPGASNAHR